MPMIKVGKFHVDSVGELECRLVAKQLGIVGQFHFVLAQVLDVLLDGNFQILGQHDQFGRLVQSFIVPSRMLCPKDVADAVVLPQPDGGHDEQTRLHAEQRVSESHLHNRLIINSKFKIHLNRFLKIFYLFFFRRVRWIYHANFRRIAKQRRKLLSVDNTDLHLALAERAESILSRFVDSVNVRNVDTVSSAGKRRPPGLIRPEELVAEMLGVISEENVGAFGFRNEFLPLEKSLGELVDIGQFFFT